MNDTDIPDEDDGPGDAQVDLVGSVWRAMDEGLDEEEIRDVVDQATSTWEPDEESDEEE